MTSKEIYEKYLKAENEYYEARLKFMDSKVSDFDSYVHSMYLMGRMHALDELYRFACDKEKY